MNDTNFIFGGTTTSTPSLYAQINDESGINTSGTSLGHDITAVLEKLFKFDRFKRLLFCYT